MGYVAQLKEIISSAPEEKKAGELRNVMREDENPTKTGQNTDDIVEEFPEKDRNYLKVKKIL